MGVLRVDLEGSLNDLLDNITKLRLLEDTKNLDSRADGVLTKTEVTKRKVGLFIKRRDSSVATVEPTEGEPLSTDAGVVTGTSSHSTVSHMLLPFQQLSA